jgi:hypothetical protein
MAQDINPNLNGPFNTQIPEYGDAADIVAALRLFLYGTTTPPTSTSEIQEKSIAHHLQLMKNDISAINSRGIGSSVTNDAPVTPIEGYVWMKKNSSASNSVVFPSAIFTNTPPASNTVTDGALWVDRDSVPLTMYIFDSLTNAWKPIGV